MAVIDALDGIGPVDARALRRMGIRTTEALLRRATTAEGRREVVSRVTLGEEEVLALARSVDLMRINGMGVLYCRLLQRVGVSTIEDLRTWNAHTLRAMLFQVNERHRMVRRLPNLERVTAWITEAQSIEPVVEG